MKLYMAGVSVATVAMAMAGPTAAQQDQGAHQQQGGERDPAEITCMDLSVMDTAMVPGALYYIAGHRAGSGETGGGSESGGQQADDGSPGQQAAGGPGGETQIVRIRGFFEIPIEETIIACAETPDTPVAEVIEEQRAGADGSSGGDTGTPANGSDNGGGAAGGDAASGEDAAAGGTEDDGTDAGGASGGGGAGEDGSNN